MFIDADHHPFHEKVREVVSADARGGSSGEVARDERGVHEYVRPADRPRGLYIRDDSRD
jgi:hypothetical protein